MVHALALSLDLDMVVDVYGHSGKDREAAPQQWFIRKASTDLSTDRKPPSCGRQNAVNHVTETIGHDSPKYALHGGLANVFPGDA